MSTQVSTNGATNGGVPATAPARLEVTTLFVADVDRAKAFYQGLGWRLDIDFRPTPEIRGVQFTPPGSAASIQFGEGGSAMTGPLDGLILVVDDIEAAREDLMGRGVDVGEVWHLDLEKGPQPGPDPEGKSYANRANFSDPDGNQWALQQITDRLPGRVERTDSAPLAELLAETAEHHGAYEAIAPPHDWWDWYGAYFAARQDGDTPDQADKAADAYMKEARGVAVSR
jgi:catechol 2,3-dioxygenase-like lactoylglutathione lyase family enzyme